MLDVGSLHNDDYPYTPEERSLNVRPAHVDLHVGGLVQEDVVLGGGWQYVGEGDGVHHSSVLSFCSAVLLLLRDGVHLIQP